MSASSITLAVDAMGGDHGVKVTVPAALTVLREDESLKIILVGDEDILRTQLKPWKQKEILSRLEVYHASQVVAMDDPPAQALRAKRQSSMWMAVDLVREGEAQACVSAGNTGALMAISRFLLKMVTGIDRPAIATFIPNLKGESAMLDLGANVDCTARNLVEFAIMGSILAQALLEKNSPTVGLLNVGEEAIKGNEVARVAAEALRAGPLNFYGNIEGHDIYLGTTDVIVCDGFVGNAVLKASEGLVQMVNKITHEEYERGFFSRLAAFFSWPVLSRIKTRLDPRRYNGASFAGLRGTVLKSHGGADIFAFSCALRRAKKEVAQKVVSLIAESLEEARLGA